MLQWTAAGAVATPRTIQIRVQRIHPDRVKAGAPEPERSLSPEELERNIRFFTQGMSGPRSRPCTRLVLSGVDVAQRPDLPAAIHLARGLGVKQIVLHASTRDLNLAQHAWQSVDCLVLPLPPTKAVRIALRPALSTLEIPWTALLRIQHNPEPSHAELLHEVLALQPTEVILSSPFPLTSHTPPPELEKAHAWLDACAEILDPASLSWRVQGLPGCYLGAHSNRIRRASNRWYVDSEHQLDQALRFFPDVTRFHKAEVCRFCTLDGQCDGFFSQWAGRYGLPDLEPLS